MSAGDRVAFDLVDQPWLIARTLDGEPVELSLTEVFARAHDLAVLAGDVPTQVFASTRLLLAVLHDALRGPEDMDAWEELWTAPRLPIDTIADYLAEHRGRFDLFHPETPFLQVAGLRTAKDETTDLSRLIADVPNNAPFFSTRMGRPLVLSFAEAARWVVHCHAFDPSGIKSGAVGDPRVKGGRGYPIGTGWSGNLGAVLPEGRTLRETLLLNLMPYEHGLMQQRDPDQDVPAWRRPPAGPAEDMEGGRPPTGPLDLYTWQSRRVRLVHDDAHVTSVLICNGDRITPQNKNIFESHTAWRRSKAQEAKLRSGVVYMPKTHEPQRAVWRGLQSLLPGAAKPQSNEAAAYLTPDILEWVAEVRGVIGEAYPVRLRTIGMTYGSNNSVTDEVVDDALSMKAVLLGRGVAELPDMAVRCVQAAEKAAWAVGKLAERLADAAGCGKDELEGPRTRATESAYALLDPLFRAWLETLGADTVATDAETAWHDRARAGLLPLVRNLLAAAPAKALKGRVGNEKRFVNSPLAQGWFFGDLGKALHRTSEQEGEAGS